MSNKPNQVTKVKEPLVRVTKRDVIPTWQKWAVRLIAILLSLVVVIQPYGNWTGRNIWSYVGRRI